MSEQDKHQWKAQEYNKHSSVQFESALNLLRHIRLKGDEHILDIGCGDGKITAHLSKQVANGSVLGIDSSEEMVDFAQKIFPRQNYPNLAFMVQNAEKMFLPNQFNIIFSSFALQWVKDIDSFLSRAYSSLTPSGYLVATVPLSISLPLEQSIKEITHLGSWASHFHEFSPGWHFRDEQEIKRLLTMHRFKPVLLKVIFRDTVFPSRESFESYIKPWFSYLCPLPDHFKDVFFKQIIDRYLEIEPIVDEGIHFKFPHLDIVAAKATL